MDNPQDISQDVSKVFVLQRQERVYTLARSGLTLTTISKLLSISLSTVISDIQAYALQLTKTLQMTASLSKTIQLDRLQYLEEKIATQIKNGDLKAIKLGLEIVHTKCNILGLKGLEDAGLDNFPVNVEDIQVEIDEMGILPDDPAFAQLDSIDEAIPSKPKKAKKISELDDEELKNIYFARLKESGV